MATKLGDYISADNHSVDELQTIYLTWIVFICDSAIESIHSEEGLMFEPKINQDHVSRIAGELHRIRELGEFHYNEVLVKSIEQGIDRILEVNSLDNPYNPIDVIIGNYYRMKMDIYKHTKLACANTRYTTITRSEFV